MSERLQPSFKEQDKRIKAKQPKRLPVDEVRNLEARWRADRKRLKHLEP